MQFLSRSTTRWFGLLAVFMALVACFAKPAQASTLDDILKRGKITIGITTDYPPYGELDKNQQPAGYDVDVAKLLGHYLGVQVDLVPVSSPNRIPYLLSGKVDVLVALLGVTLERAKQVAFSSPYSATDVVIVGPRKTHIASAADLAGKRISVVRASSNEGLVRKIAPSGTSILPFDSDMAGIQAVLSGQTDAIASGVEVITALNKANPGLQAEVKFTLRHQLNAAAVRREDTDLLRWINTFVLYAKTSGELDAIQRNWVGSPLPNLPTL
jgi:polar amino acid transport system substrate-binding protein